MKKIQTMCLMGLFGLTGCATIMSDNKSAVQIDTNPTETICEVKGENFTQTVTIPANVTIPAKASPVTITCTKESYFPATETIKTTIDGMIFGNIIFGGIPGIVVDLMTKSGFVYQENVALHLYKKEFTSEEKKENYYNEMVAKLNSEIQDKKSALAEKHTDTSSEYKKGLKKIDEYQKVELEYLEKCKADSIIVNTNIAKK